MKYCVITGGVISGLGKGIIASSTGLLFRKLGYHVSSIKIDPYLNIDAGTMSPFEHGEVFILDDGGEVDLDLGNYERFLDVTLSKDHNITTGKIYSTVIEKERRGDYLGKTVQVIPHISDEIQSWIKRVSAIPTTVESSIASEDPQICIIELGGTIGDIESMAFVEALRQFQFKVGKENFVLIHVSLVPTIGGGEHKTKPTQASVRELRSLGLIPDIIICRSHTPFSSEVKAKISQYCNVDEEHVLAVHNLPNLYHVPILLKEQNLPSLLLSHFKLPFPEGNFNYLGEWEEHAHKVDKLNAKKEEEEIKIAMVGKYTGLTDSYLSIITSLHHAATFLNEKVKIIWVEASDLDLDLEQNIENNENWAKIKKADGILVPGGFGERGVEGMIATAKYARENKVPYFGICLGFQIAVIEISRNLLGWVDATSEEFSTSSTYPVIVHMPEVSRSHMGGTMRLGQRRTIFKTQDCKTAKLYGNLPSIEERHRHRYEVNPKFIDSIESVGLKFVGHDIEKERMEIFELEDHPYYVGTQYHPEMKTRPTKPSAPFVGLISAAKERKNNFSQ